MLKIIGTALIIVCCTMIGNYKHVEIIKKVNVTENLIKMMIYIENNIRYFKKPLSVIFQEMYESELFLNLDFIAETYEDMKNGENFRECFIKNITVNQIKLDKHILKILLDFAENVGTSDSESEMKKLEYYKQILYEEEKKIKEYKEKTGKLYLSLGVFAGMAIALFLM